MGSTAVCDEEEEAELSRAVIFVAEADAEAVAPAEP